MDTVWVLPQEDTGIENSMQDHYDQNLHCLSVRVVPEYMDCTNLVSDLRSPRYSVLQPLLETPISAIVFILQPEVMFVGVVMIKT